MVSPEDTEFQIPEGTFGTRAPRGPGPVARGCFKSRKERLGPYPTAAVRPEPPKFQIPEGTFGTQLGIEAYRRLAEFQIPEGTFGTPRGLPVRHER